MSFVVETISYLSSNSLFSCIITLYALLFLYSPCFFFPFVFSPVIFTTLILLLHLLRLGAAQTSVNDQSKSEELDVIVGSEDSRAEDTNRFYSEPFVEWDVRAPLEVIYEEHELEECDDENDSVSEVLRREAEMNVIRKYASLSLFYPESDSDSSCSSEGGFTGEGDGNSPGNVYFLWEDDDDDDDKEGLIEIALDEKRHDDDVDEENLIEIDLCPAHDVDFRQA